MGLAKACELLNLEHKPSQLLNAKQVYLLVCEATKSSDTEGLRIINYWTYNVLEHTSKLLMAHPSAKITIANEEYVLIEYSQCGETRLNVFIRKLTKR